MNYCKKGIRVEAADLSQAGPNPAACSGLAGRIGTPSFDQDRTMRGSSSWQGCACMRARRRWLGFGEGGAYRGCFSGRWGLVQWRRRSEGGTGPGEVHARAAEVEVMPRLSS
jgi:hypothetical protein